MIGVKFRVASALCRVSGKGFRRCESYAHVRLSLILEFTIALAFMRWLEFVICLEFMIGICFTHGVEFGLG